MNIIIYTLIILTIFYFLMKWWRVVSRKMSKSVRLLAIFILIILAVIFAVGGKILLTLPLTLLSLALVKLKGLSIFQLFSLFHQPYTDGHQRIVAERKEYMGLLASRPKLDTCPAKNRQKMVCLQSIQICKTNMGLV